jgi:hypothetical protein
MEWERVASSDEGPNLISFEIVHKDILSFLDTTVMILLLYTLL